VTDLVRRSEDAFPLPSGVVSTETAMNFSSATHLSYEEWETLGERLGRLHSGIQFWLGDWFYFGEGCYRDGEKYEQALEATGRSVGGLYNLKWVAEKVRPEVRRADLSWSHHREVAKLPPEEQAAWLARAVEGRWSVDLLRSTIRAETDLTTWRDPQPVGSGVSTRAEIAAEPAQRDDADRERVQATPLRVADCDRLRRLCKLIISREKELPGCGLTPSIIERLRRAVGKDA
jgi:hypothetical protein